jgi:hypothetical protein
VRGEHNFAIDAPAVGVSYNNAKSKINIFFHIIIKITIDPNDEPKIITTDNSLINIIQIFKWFKTIYINFIAKNVCI